MPPASAAVATVAEMLTDEFFAQYGLRPPKPKSYAGFAEAMAAIIIEVVEGEP